MKSVLRILPLLIAMPLLVGCRPRGILSSRQMRDVLIDIHQTEAVMQAAGYKYGHREEQAKYYATTLGKHGITQAQFDSSLVWYTNHPQLFNKIYPKVIADMEARYALWEAANADALLNPPAVLSRQDRLRLERQRRLEAERCLDSVQWVLRYGPGNCLWLSDHSFPPPDSIPTPVVPYAVPD